jgi:hypothetical protein
VGEKTLVEVGDRAVIGFGTRPFTVGDVVE